MSASGNAIEARTFRSALLQHSGEFLKALPIPGLGLTMSPKDFRLSVRSYLGMKLFPRENLFARFAIQHQMMSIASTQATAGQQQGMKV
jgi:hypothetical protein